MRSPPIWLILAFAITSLGWCQDLRSPRIAQLAEEIRNDPWAAERFWDEIAQLGTPMVERIDSEPDNVLVTFLWRGSGSLQNVIVFSSVLPANDPEQQKLSNLPGADVWHRTYRYRRDAQFLYELSPDGPTKLQRDPLNSRFLPGNMGGSIAILPGAGAQRWSESGSAPKGRLDTLRFMSDTLQNERVVQVYSPADRGESSGLLVVLDEETYSSAVPLATILDNLIAARRIRPTTAILIGNVNRAAELACSAPFAAMVAKELIPWVSQRYQLQLRPEQTTIAGSSLGGLAAVFAGWKHPETFGRVIAISGSFRWRPAGEGEPEWLTRQIASSATTGVRYSVSVGSYETGTTNEPGDPSLLTAARHLRDVLSAKGYRVQYAEFPGAHEPLSWRAAIAQALMAAPD